MYTLRERQYFSLMYTMYASASRNIPLRILMLVPTWYAECPLPPSPRDHSCILICKSTMCPWKRAMRQVLPPHVKGGHVWNPGKEG